jgi:hypothetical protein
MEGKINRQNENDIHKRRTEGGMKSVNEGKRGRRISSKEESS